MDNILQQPEISVLMPAYNREEFISDSIKSILNQTFTDFELIILDDASTDNTVKKILEFNDCRIRILKNEENKGIPYSRNRLLKEARGKFFALLDSDDIALPTRFQKQIDFLKANNDNILVGSPCIFINKNGIRRNGKWSFLTPLQTDPEEIKATLLFRNCFSQSSIMINAELFKNAEYDVKYPSWEDYKLWTKLASNHRLTNLKEPLILYRSYSENISHSTEDSRKLQLFNEVIKEQFRGYFNYEPTEEELFVHSSWYFGSFKQNAKSLKDSSKWLKKLKEMNRNQKAFDTHLFNKVLKKNWFDRCWHHINKGNISASFYFLFFLIDFSLKDIFLFFYFSIKGVYAFSRNHILLNYTNA
ncbi:MAG: glycosyltransferase [Bacteroidota bacterium]|nr:glycosyltransferase [Bacteroidota bacterium]